MLLRELTIRQKKLESIIRTTTAWLAKAPKGSLRVSKKAFYVIEGKHDTTGVRTKDNRLITALATKQYYEKAQKEAKKELSWIKRLIEVEKRQPVAAVYGKLNPKRKRLVRPLEDTIQDKIRIWRSEQSVSLPIKEGKWALRTESGDYVRSTAEALIANKLYQRGIPYKTDVEFGVDNFSSYWVDFVIINPNTGEKFYWEHLGMMDKPDYVAKNIKKLEFYASKDLYPGNGLILTFEDKDHKLSEAHVERIIEDLLV